MVSRKKFRDGDVIHLTAESLLISSAKNPHDYLTFECLCTYESIWISESGMGNFDFSLWEREEGLLPCSFTYSGYGCHKSCQPALPREPVFRYNRCNSSAEFTLYCTSQGQTPNNFQTHITHTHACKQKIMRPYIRQRIQTLVRVTRHNCRFMRFSWFNLTISVPDVCLTVLCPTKYCRYSVCYEYDWNKLQ